MSACWCCLSDIEYISHSPSLVTIILTIKPITLKCVKVGGGGWVEMIYMLLCSWWLNEGVWRTCVYGLHILDTLDREWKHRWEA